MVVASQDSASLFRDLSLGAESSISVSFRPWICLYIMFDKDLTEFLFYLLNYYEIFVNLAIHLYVMVVDSLAMHRVLSPC